MSQKKKLCAADDMKGALVGWRKEAEGYAINLGENVGEEHREPIGKERMDGLDSKEKIGTVD